MSFTLDRITEQGQLIRRYDEMVDKFRNLPQVLIEGRQVTRVPSGSSDVAAGDQLGDVNFSQNDYIYFLIDNSGTPAWRRIALASW